MIVSEKREAVTDPEVGTENTERGAVREKAEAVDIMRKESVKEAIAENVEKVTETAETVKEKGNIEVDIEHVDCK